MLFVRCFLAVILKADSKGRSVLIQQAAKKMKLAPQQNSDSKNLNNKVSEKRIVTFWFNKSCIGLRETKYELL
jgi:hypothetical protein